MNNLGDKAKNVLAGVANDVATGIGSAVAGVSKLADNAKDKFGGVLGDTDKEFDGIYLSNVPSLRKMYDACVKDGKGALNSKKEELDKWVKENIEEEEDERERKKHMAELRALLTYYSEEDRKKMFSQEALDIFNSIESVGPVEDESDDKEKITISKALEDIGELEDVYSQTQTTFTNKGSRVEGFFESPEEMTAGSELARMLSVVHDNIGSNKELRQKFIAAMRASGCELVSNEELKFEIGEGKSFSDILVSVNQFIKENNLSIPNDLRRTEMSNLGFVEAGRIAKTINKFGEDYPKNLRFLYMFSDKIKGNTFNSKVKEQLEAWNGGFNNLEEAGLFLRGMKYLPVGNKGKIKENLKTGLDSFEPSFGPGSDIKDIYLAMRMLDEKNVDSDFKNKLKLALVSGLGEVKDIEKRLPKEMGNKLAGLLGREVQQEEPKKEEDKSKPKPKNEKEELE